MWRYLQGEKIINCYFLSGKKVEKQITDFSEIEIVLEKNRKDLYNMGLEGVIKILSELSKHILSNQELLQIGYMEYLSDWLSEKNLREICNNNYGVKNPFEQSQDLNGLKIIAAPRGIASHWVAENIPTIAIFSLVQGLLSLNANVMKVPKNSVHPICLILEILSGIELEFNGKKLLGSDLSKNVVITTFPSSETFAGNSLSQIADVKLIWGGKEAVSSITQMPQKEHCEILTFGPKYSFGVYAKDAIESNLEENLKGSALDIVLFNQMACSSPHVLFFEKSKYPLDEIANKLAEAFDSTPKKYFMPLNDELVSKIMNKRGEYLLDKKKVIKKSKTLEWTILLDNKLSLEEPIAGRCIFLKEINSILDVIPLITHKVQTISLACLDDKLTNKFFKCAAYVGVSRITPPGKMLDFYSPWDGMMQVSRLVRWVSLKN